MSENNRDTDAGVMKLYAITTVAFIIIGFIIWNM